MILLVIFALVAVRINFQKNCWRIHIIESFNNEDIRDQIIDRVRRFENSSRIVFLYKYFISDIFDSKIMTRNLQKAISQIMIELNKEIFNDSCYDYSRSISIRGRNDANPSWLAYYVYRQTFFHSQNSFFFHFIEYSHNNDSINQIDWYCSIIDCYSIIKVLWRVLASSSLLSSVFIVTFSLHHDERIIDNVDSRLHDRWASWFQQVKLHSSLTLYSILKS